MNGFRITVLTLLCLSLGLMFYAICFVVPSWQGEYNAYQLSLRTSEYDRKSDIHRRQMVNYAPSYESPEVVQARQEVEATARQGEQAVVEAEENNVLAAARRREEIARERQKAENDDVVSTATIGLVASYDPEWQCIMIRPAVPEAFVPGTMLAVRRDKRILCEAVVDNFDSESGQVSATIKVTAAVSGAAGQDELAPEQRPEAGDEVMPSPFPTGDELRAEAGQAPRVRSALAPTERAVAEPAPMLPQPQQQAAEEPAPAPEPAAEKPTEQPTPAAPAAPAAPAPAAPTAAEPMTPPSNEGQDTSARRPLPSLDAMLHESLF